MSRATIAYLKKDSPFAPIFPEGIPILNVLPMQAVLTPANGDGETREEVYMVDLDKLTEQQFEATLALVQKQCGPAVSLVQCRKEIKALGLPLRAKHVASVTIDARFL